MNKIKSSLSGKIFLGIAMILLAVSLLLFGTVRIFMPKTYEYEMAARIASNAVTLTEQLKTAPQSDWDDLLIQFCLANNADADILDETGKQIAGFSSAVYSVTVEDGIAKQSKKSESSMTESFSSAFESGGKTYMFISYVNAEAVEQVTGVFAKVFPYVFTIIIVISALAAFVYSRILAKPIVNISNVSKRMTALDMTWRCDIRRSDEIGVLAANLNEMAVRLDSTMKELKAANEKLQADIEREREQERRRRDFFSAVSHELKTPVAAVSAMLENMLLGVGKYKEHDVYLAKCKQQIDSLGGIVKEILNTSNLDGDARQEKHEVNVAELVSAVAEPYQMIAKARGVILEIDVSGGFTANLSLPLFEKAVSNILSNAVAYTEEKGNVRVYLDSGRLIVENECTPIAPERIGDLFEPFYRHEAVRGKNTEGNGLGLYITAKILKLLGVRYSFTPTASPPGMRFMIDLN